MLIHCSGITDKSAGGYASVIYNKGKSFRVSVGQGQSVTKLQMETLAVLDALKLGIRYLQEGDTVQLVTDCLYVVETCNHLPTIRREGYAGVKNPVLWREMYDLMRILGDRLYIDLIKDVPMYETTHIQTVKAANIAMRLDLADYISDPETYSGNPTIIRGVQLK